jgi:hypothetical protein
LRTPRKDSRHHGRKECKTGVLPSFHLDLPEQEAAEEFIGACTRKVLIRVGKVCGHCKRWRRERSHY